MVIVLPVLPAVTVVGAMVAVPPPSPAANTTLLGEVIVAKTRLPTIRGIIASSIMTTLAMSLMPFPLKWREKSLLRILGQYIKVRIYKSSPGKGFDLRSSKLL
jgi:hypothetical protein